MKCSCPDRSAWRIVHYRCNFSAFNGYQRAPSDYSLLECERCGARWRTKAKYVDRIAAQTRDAGVKPML